MMSRSATPFVIDPTCSQLPSRVRAGTTSSNGVIQTGVSKNYIYDQRLKYLSPPHFIDPTRSEWQINTWAEVLPAYSG